MTRVIITGIGGYGRVHLENAQRLQGTGRLTIAAVVDPAVPDAYDSLGEALDEHEADVVIVATPLHTHAELAEQAMRAGADVLLEKPPVPTLAEFERLLAVQRETGRAVQVGFQSLGSHAIPALQANVITVSATGLWSRSHSYWNRARWAGHRVLDGRPVGDGVATNALAHAIATALRIAGYADAASVTRVEVKAFRANPIETDDTVALRISGNKAGAALPTVTCALTLCAPPEIAQRPDRGAVVNVVTPKESVAFSYTTDVVTSAGGAREYGRTDLLENLLDHRETGAQLLVPLESTGAFMRVAEAIQQTAPIDIGAEHVTWAGDGGERHPIIANVEQWARRVTAL